MLIHRSPAFTSIYNDIKRSENKRVLDLSAAAVGVDNLLSSLECDLVTRDISTPIGEYLEALDGDKAISPEHFEACLNSAFFAESAENAMSGEMNAEMSGEKLPNGEALKDGEKEGGEKFDVVLLWDTANYLSLEAVKVLFDTLRSRCQPNALVYLLRYGNGSIPDQPCQFTVKDQYLLEASRSSRALRRAQNFTTLELLEVMDGFSLKESLSGHMGMIQGVTEHILQFSLEADMGPKAVEITQQPVEASVARNLKSRTYFSPAIADVMSLLQNSDDIAVLDVGSERTRNQDFIVKNSANYCRSDIFSSIERSRKKGVQELNLSELEKYSNEKFDVIIAWDIFNYCSTAQVSQLNRIFQKLSHTNTFLLAFMYTGRKPPFEPGIFSVNDNSEVNICTSNVRDNYTRGITGASLLSLLNAFSMDKTYAYREGMDREVIEYIFALNESYAELSPSKYFTGQSVVEQPR